MTDSLTTRQVRCFGGELFGVLQKLKAEGWRVSTIKVKGTCEYTLTVVYDWRVLRAPRIP
jgi:hypothetical protein